MKRKQLDLIQLIIEQSKPVTGSEIAAVLDISPRTVKNYIKEINDTYDKNIIISSRNGYEINPNFDYSIIIDKDDNIIPQSFEERTFYIIKRLYSSHGNGVNIFELADELYIGYSTLKSIIAKMNRNFIMYNISFICDKNTLKIKGLEQDKRKLLSYVINEEAKNSYMNIDLLKNNFDNIDVYKLRDIIAKTYKEHNFYLNDFSCTNILLHLLIIIDRELSGNFILQGEHRIYFDNEDIEYFYNEIIEKLENTFKLKFNLYTKFEIFALLKSNVNFLDNKPTKILEIVGPDYLDLVNEYVEKINNIYMIDLSSPTFITPFCLHLKNLIYRASRKTFAKNPMTSTIRLNSPMVFEVAVFIALDLGNRFNFKLNEDETAFLAMHIGAEVERQQLNKNKITAILICPEYNGLSQMLANSLMINFGSQINLIACINDESELIRFNYYSLIITTIKLNKVYKGVQVAFISPLNIQSQFGTIQDAILKNVEYYSNRKLKANFSNLFEKDLFFTECDNYNDVQIIHMLCEKLVENNYVGKNYENYILEREAVAITCFGDIAIPHSMEPKAYKTCISVAISKKGIQWKNNIVHVVFLLAINKADIKLFKCIYESLISLFEEESNIQAIRNCKDFKDFENTIYKFLKDKEEN